MACYNVHLRLAPEGQVRVTITEAFNARRVEFGVPCAVDLSPVVDAVVKQIASLGGGYADWFLNGFPTRIHPENLSFPERPKDRS